MGLILSAGPASAFSLPVRPGSGAFISDQARMLEPGDESRIQQVCQELMDQKKIPLMVVTIDSLASQGAAGMPIERYAAQVFDSWGIGRSDWDYGILVLVAKGDRKARIQLGAGWRHEKDGTCREIMDEYMLSSFKKRDFSGGIRQGAEALAAMAGDRELPGLPQMKQIAIWVVVTVIVLLLLIHLGGYVSYRNACHGGYHRSGSYGRARHSGYRGSYHSHPRSSGGGHTGGGGATGSW
jgi:uncharacterized protein